MDVTKAITMKGGILTSAILSGDKDIENRSAAWAPGWYALHTGVGKPDIRLNERVMNMCDSDDRWGVIKENLKRCPDGHIAGLFRIAHALPPESCQTSKWCSGPVCLIVAETLFLEKPIAAKGALGTWDLGEGKVAIIKEQVPRCEIRAMGHEAIYPRDDAALERAREAKRQAKVKRARDELGDGRGEIKIGKGAAALIGQFLVGQAAVAKAAAAEA